MNKEQIELAKRWSELPETYFRWMRGMDGSSGLCIQADYTDGAPMAVWETRHGKTDWLPIDPEDYPDLTDPATAGCAEAILNELIDSESSGATVWFDKGREPRRVFEGVCIGEARVRAILAFYEAEKGGEQ